jgi:hypothetical protein
MSVSPTEPASTQRTSAGPPAWLSRLLSLTTWVGLIAFVVAEIVQLVQHGTEGLAAATLLNALVWAVGVNGFIMAGGHLFFPDPVAESIGWPKGNPFQWEVGLANLIVGVLGVMSPVYDRDFQLAAVLAFSIFYLGAAVGHVRQRFVHGNRAAGNTGFIFWFDVCAPLAVIALYVVTGR